MKRLWFYVPNYPSVSNQLQEKYEHFGVTEWSAEPGRVASHPDDADVIVCGEPGLVGAFDAWLRASGIEGLRIEGLRL